MNATGSQANMVASCELFQGGCDGHATLKKAACAGQASHPCWKSDSSFAACFHLYWGELGEGVYFLNDFFSIELFISNLLREVIDVRKMPR